MTIKEKLLAIQLELKAPKKQFNSYGNYNYRNAEDILEAVKPLLEKYKCTLVLSDNVKNFGDRYYVYASVTLMDLETTNIQTNFSEPTTYYSQDGLTVTACARDQDIIKGMHQAQITGSSSSYARKYALSGLFLIDDTKDSDFTNKNETEIRVDIHREFDNCKTMKELEDLWKSFNKVQQTEYEELKNQTKSKLGA